MVIRIECFTTAQQNQVQLYRSCIKKTKYQLFITRYVEKYLLDGKVPPLPLAITDDVDKASWIPVVLQIKDKGQTK